MNEEKTLGRRKWFQLHVREILWLTLIVALVLGWLGDRYRLSVENQKMWKAYLAQMERIDERQRDLNQVIAVAESRLAAVGMVTSVDTQKGVVDVSMGSVDGVELGNQLDVYRHVSDGKIKEVWLTGRIQIVSVGNVVSMGKIVYVVESHPIQRGDLVEFRRALYDERPPP